MITTGQDRAKHVSKIKQIIVAVSCGIMYISITRSGVTEDSEISLEQWATVYRVRRRVRDIVSSYRLRHRVGQFECK